MTPTTSEREALVAKWRADAAFYRAGGEPDKSVAYDRCADELAALTRREAQQEAQGAVRYVRWHPKHGFNWKALDDEPYGANENWRSVALFTTQPAPVDVRKLDPEIDMLTPEEMRRSYGRSNHD